MERHAVCQTVHGQLSAGLGLEVVYLERPGQGGRCSLHAVRACSAVHMRHTPHMDSHHKKSGYWMPGRTCLMR
jgi:hypothetical protein